MKPVRIATVAVAHPVERVRQCDVPRMMGLRGVSALKARAVARGSGIHERRIVLGPAELGGLRSIEQRNADVIGAVRVLAGGSFWRRVLTSSGTLVY